MVGAVSGEAEGLRVLGSGQCLRWLPKQGGQGAGLVGLSQPDPAAASAGHGMDAKLLPHTSCRHGLDFFLGAAGEALEGRMDFTLVLFKVAVKQVKVLKPALLSPPLPAASSPTPTSQPHLHSDPGDLHPRVCSEPPGCSLLQPAWRLPLPRGAREAPHPPRALILTPLLRLHPGSYISDSFGLCPCDSEPPPPPSNLLTLLCCAYLPTGPASWTYLGSPP